jgi:hypothetical protein
MQDRAKVMHQIGIADAADGGKRVMTNVTMVYIFNRAVLAQLNESSRAHRA